MLTTMKMRGAIAALALVGGLSAAAEAQPAGRSGRSPRADQTLPEGGVSPAEIQRLFDAYVVMQAQTELQLNDEQYPRFLTRVRALQEARRRGLFERGRILQELRRLSAARPIDETQTRAALRRLAEHDSRTAAAVLQAIDSVDQVLDLRQQARFRIFEEQMERRKVDLLLRARQGNRRQQP
jgi:hypothetical protein